MPARSRSTTASWSGNRSGISLLLTAKACCRFSRKVTSTFLPSLRGNRSGLEHNNVIKTAPFREERGCFLLSFPTNFLAKIWVFCLCEKAKNTLPFLVFFYIIREIVGVCSLGRRIQTLGEIVVSPALRFAVAMMREHSHRNGRLYGSRPLSTIVLCSQKIF